MWFYVQSHIKMESITFITVSKTCIGHYIYGSYMTSKNSSIQTYYEDGHWFILTC